MWCCYNGLGIYWLTWREWFVSFVELLVLDGMRLTGLYRDFFNSERAGGLLLVFATVVSLLLANSRWQVEYINLWHLDLGGHSLLHWINDGLMAVFFLLIGLELEREVYRGELSNIRNALLPAFGAVGGMLVPAGIYLLFNFGGAAQGGAGIPMATDIAFAVGILSLLGNRVPPQLKVFLTALAVIDDLGAIVVIAVFYTGSVSVPYLLASLGVWGLLLMLNGLRVYRLLPYVAGGLAMWYFMLHSGIHAGITGVLLAFAVPFGGGCRRSPSVRLEHFLQRPVAFGILPLFALANICIPLGDNVLSGFAERSSVGIMAGYLVGKPLGIFLFSLAAVKLGISGLPQRVRWADVVGVGFLGGIGFTMSIFITLLAFSDGVVIDYSKKAILLSSVVAGVVGFVVLYLSLRAKGDSVGR